MSARPCLARLPAAHAPGMDYYCTLNKGHKGDHQARGWQGDQIGTFVRWPREASR